MRVLFVCTGNTCRSPMAAALATALQPDWEVRSAGLAATAGEPISREAAAALDRRGLPWEGHRATRLTQELVDWADRILVMTRAHQERLEADLGAGDKVALLAAGGVSDPYMGTAQEYEACALTLEEALSTLTQRPSTR